MDFSEDEMKAADLLERKIAHRFEKGDLVWYDGYARQALEVVESRGENFQFVRVHPIAVGPPVWVPSWDLQRRFAAAVAVEEST